MALMCSVWVKNSAGVIKEACFTGSTIVHAKKKKKLTAFTCGMQYENATVCTPSQLQNNSLPFVLLSTECILPQTDILKQTLYNQNDHLYFT